MHGRAVFEIMSDHSSDQSSFISNRPAQTAWISVTYRAHKKLGLGA
jgi:hypothetical protein